MGHAHTTGRRGERHAARWLRRRGLRILARNVRTPAGEIDLLAREGSWLVVVEVKTGRTADPDTLEARIDRTQRRRLHAAVRWVDETAREDAAPGWPRSIRGVRCDWVLVRLAGRKPTVLHIRDVFGE